MSFARPASLEILLEQIIGHWLLSPFYRSFVKGLDLDGHECILEFGCGGGNLSRHLARVLRNNGALTCLDTSEYWLGRAQRRLKRFVNIRFDSRDIRKNPLPEGSMDVAVVHYVLHDIEEPARDEIVRALAKSLRPGGRICIREPMAKGHGMNPEAIRTLMNRAGMKETRAVARKTCAGSSFEAVCARPDSWAGKKPAKKRSENSRPL